MKFLILLGLIACAYAAIPERNTLIRKKRFLGIDTLTAGGAGLLGNVVTGATDLVSGGVSTVTGGLTKGTDAVSSVLGSTIGTVTMGVVPPALVTNLVSGPAGAVIGIAGGVGNAALALGSGGLVDTINGLGAIGTSLMKGDIMGVITTLTSLPMTVLFGSLQTLALQLLSQMLNRRVIITLVCAVLIYLLLGYMGY